MDVFSNESDRLSPLETFEPAAFLADEGNPREVCGFVLALATAYEDFKDIILADQLIQSERPEGQPCISAAWGQYNGFQAYLRRLLAGVFHELFRLIERNRDILSGPALTDTVKRMNSEAREAWHAIVAAALSRTSDSDLAKVLAIVRNKVVFHYGSEEILKGYEIRFSRLDAESRPFVSRGTTMRSSRFYFADAAADAYFRKQIDAPGLGEEFGPRSHLMRAVSTALWSIVLSFVERRGYPLRQATNGT